MGLEVSRTGFCWIWACFSVGERKKCTYMTEIPSVTHFEEDFTDTYVHCDVDELRDRLVENMDSVSPPESRHSSLSKDTTLTSFHQWTPASTELIKHKTHTWITSFLPLHRKSPECAAAPGNIRFLSVSGSRVHRSLRKHTKYSIRIVWRNQQRFRKYWAWNQNEDLF